LTLLKHVNPLNGLQTHHISPLFRETNTLAHTHPLFLTNTCTPSPPPHPTPTHPHPPHRPDRDALLKAIHEVVDKADVVKEGWNGYNVIHDNASRVAALDIGFAPR
jgi:hypothetical protein